MSEEIDTSAENFVAILFTDIVDSTAQQRPMEMIG